MLFITVMSVMVRFHMPLCIIPVNKESSLMLLDSHTVVIPISDEACTSFTLCTSSFDFFIVNNNV